MRQVYAYVANEWALKRIDKCEAKVVNFRIIPTAGTFVTLLGQFYQFFVLYTGQRPCIACRSPPISKALKR